MDKLSFSKNLLAMMNERKLTQAQLAEMVGCRQSQVSNWCSGKSMPNYVNIQALARVLRVDYNCLLGI